MKPSAPATPQRVQPAAIFLAVLLAFVSSLGTVLGSGAPLSATTAHSQGSAEQHLSTQPAILRAHASEQAFASGDAPTGSLLLTRGTATPAYTRERQQRAWSSRPTLAFAQIRDGLTRAPPLA